MTYHAGAHVRIADGRVGRFVGVHREQVYERGVPRSRQWAVVELDRGGRAVVAFDRLEVDDAHPPGTPYRDDDDDELERELADLLRG